MEDRAGAPRSGPAEMLAAELRPLVGKFKRRLREQTNSSDLTPSQTAVLLRLEKDGPATMSSLARGEGMRPQSMASLIAPLEASGLVRGDPDPQDKRQTILSLTEFCRQRMARNRAAKQDWLAGKIQSLLSEAEQTQLAAAIELLWRLVEN